LKTQRFFIEPYTKNGQLTCSEGSMRNSTYPMFMAPILCLTQATNMNRKMFDPLMGVQQSGVLYHVIAG